MHALACCGPPQSSSLIHTHYERVFSSISTCMGYLPTKQDKTYEVNISQIPSRVMSKCPSYPLTWLVIFDQMQGSKASEGSLQRMLISFTKDSTDQGATHNHERDCANVAKKQIPLAQK